MENVDGKPPLPPPRKYVSIFCIDGEPILPPLMTLEKRGQMRKLKERAVTIEKRLAESKQKVNSEQHQHNEFFEKENCIQQNKDNISQQSQEKWLQETEESMELLKTFLQRQLSSTENKTKEAEKAAFEHSSLLNRNESHKKLQNLRKSEILIYDNFSNEVIQVPADKEQKKSVQDIGSQLTNTECQTNIVNIPSKKPSHLLLAGINGKGIASIPSICLNPPTPLTVDKTWCDTLSIADSSESMWTSENPSQSLDFSHDLSSDESFNSMITQSDKKPYRNSVKKNPHTPEKNVCAKIQQYEAISSGTNTPQTSPVKVCKNRKICLGTPSGTMNRSATSPSIKLNTSNRSSSSRSQSLAQDSDTSPESNLVRSSSFTLEGPSAALIEHMQQQEAIKVTTKSESKFAANTTRNLAKKSISAPLRAHRDTVESKAKKVQKMELKSPKLKPQPKTIQSKLSQAASASKSPYKPTTPTQHISLCKTNRSPSHTSPQTMQISNATQMRKSNSISSYLPQTKSPNSKSAPSSTSVSNNSTKPAQTGNVFVHQLGKKQKEKILQLLAKQEQEHRQLQYTYVLQEKILSEKLRREMAAYNLKFPDDPFHLTSTTSTSEQNKNDQLQTSSSRKLNHKNLASPLAHSSQRSTADSLDSVRHKTQSIQHQSPPSVSNSSQLSNAFDRSQSKNQHSHQNSSYSSQYAQSPQPIQSNNSHLFVMDHSNANTSLDISTLSLQTSPDTPKTQTNSAHNNTVVNKNTPSSRRRLFSAEINGVNGDLSALTSRSAVTTPNALPHGLMKTVNHPVQYNHSNGNNRCDSADNSIILHNAATKINAFARGFLVRRLFQTEQIQRIVQTIHDTLIFVLNLHMETIENPLEAQTPVNIKLKARLLQQLSSACRTLHFVFFQTTVKVRMEIIARDRKRIKNKLMAMNSKR